MNKKGLYEVGGFAFDNLDITEKAGKEEEGIRYIKNRTDMDNPDMVLQVYRQMVDQRLFETPVGFAFLYELQEYLTAIPYIKDEDIPPIVVITSGQPEIKRKTKITEKNKKISKQPQKKETPRTRQTKNLDFKIRFRTSLFINIVLLLIMIGMFAVAATSESTNILNYENQLIQKYEDWEKELTLREEKLNEQEKLSP